MAKMYPEEYVPRYIDPNDPNRVALERGDEGEKFVYDALRDYLPDEWVVIHDYWRYFVDTRKDSYVNYESDFIVLVPYKGIVVLEVKNSKSLELCGGTWCMSGNPLPHHKESPLNQAYQAVKKLHRELKSSLHWAEGSLSVSYGSLAILLQQKFDYINEKTPYPKDEEIAQCGNWVYHDLYLCGRDCIGDRLRKRVESILKDSKCFNHDEIKRVVRYMLPNFVFKKDPKICAALIDKAAEPITMLLPMLHKNTGIIHVTGVAGTGKTWMLCNEVKRLCQLSENKILVLCFNKPLSDYLKKQLLQAAAGNVEIYTIEGFFRKIIGQDFTEKERGKPLYSLKELNIIVDRIKQKLGYTHVFIDECQDVRPPYWPPILEINNQTRNMYLFSDSNQTLYREANQMPDSFRDRVIEVELTRNLRNSLDIATFCNQMLTTKPEPLKLKCEEVIIKQGTPNILTRAQIVDSIIEALHKNKVPYGDIVILTPWAENNCIGNLQTKTQNIDDEKMKPKTVAWSTIKRFKGLERCFVILTDVCRPDNEGSFTDNDLYVACTRAKYGLYIVPADDGQWLNDIAEKTRKELRDYEEYI